MFDAIGTFVEDGGRWQIDHLVGATSGTTAPSAEEAPDEFVKYCEELAGQLPATSDLRAWVDGAKQNDVALIRRAVDTNTLSAAEAAVLADALLGVLCALLGGSHRLSGKVDSRLIHDVRFEERYADTQLGAGCQELDWHVEDGCHGELRPTWLLILCLVGGPTVRTKVARLRDMPMSDEMTQSLLESEIELRLDESFQDSESTRFPVSILADGAAGREIIFDPAFTVESDEATTLVQAVRRIADVVHSEIVLEAGDLMILNNRTCIHGRSGFDPEGPDRFRYIKRALAN
ncbi:MAG: TauD/TfdA family dioxygenase [Actinomycetota bacterium]